MKFLRMTATHSRFTQKSQINQTALVFSDEQEQKSFYVFPLF